MSMGYFEECKRRHGFFKGVILAILDELDGVNYYIERRVNKSLKSETDYAYRQYIEIFIELLRELVIDFNGYFFVKGGIIKYWLECFKGVKNITCARPYDKGLHSDLIGFKDIFLSNTTGWLLLCCSSFSWGAGIEHYFPGFLPWMF